MCALQRLAALHLASAIASRGRALQQPGSAADTGMEVDGAGADAAVAATGTDAGQQQLCVTAPARWASALVQRVAECSADVAVQQVSAH